MANTLENLVNEFLESYDLDGRNDYTNVVEFLKSKGFKTSKDGVWKIITAAKKAQDGDLEELVL
jgi:Ca2+-binding EF-hand superfamily protein